MTEAADHIRKTFEDLRSTTEPDDADEALLKGTKAELSEILNDMNPFLQQGLARLDEIASPDFIPPEDPGEFDPKRPLPRDPWEIPIGDQIRTLNHLEGLFKNAAGEFPDTPTSQITSRHIAYLLSKRRYQNYLAGAETMQAAVEIYNKIIDGRNENIEPSESNK